MVLKDEEYEPSLDDSSFISEPIILNMSEPETVSKPEEIDKYKLSVKSILSNLPRLKTSFADRVDEEYLSNVRDILGEEAVINLAYALENGIVDSDILRAEIGYTERAFIALTEGCTERTKVLPDTDDGVTELVFVGDISFDDRYSVMAAYRSRNEGIEGLVDEKVLEIMRNATITMGNNEFTLTSRGSPVPSKKYTFRGNPDNASIYHEMGIDILGLANNHASDYGEISLLDTIETLDKYDLPHVGAGSNLEEATQPYYFIVNGAVYGYVAGSVIDINTTLTAGPNQAGVFKMYKYEDMCELIRKTHEKADYVIVYAHWGVESTTELTSGQKTMGKAFVDAGADLVVGMHSHCMQGIEYYKDKLIVYSLGNFTFSSMNLTCGMLRTYVSPDGNFTNVFYPMMQSHNFTYINDGDKGKNQLEQLIKISYNVTIDDDFSVTPK